MKGKKELWMWEIIKLVIILLFAMVTGVACYHQYMILHGEPDQKEKAVSIQINQEAVEHPPVMELEVRKMDPEELDLEFYWDSLELLALCVEAEAGDQGLLGKRMVTDVILNRVDDPDWPDTIEGVITKEYHFSSWWNGAINRADPSEETFEAVRMELEERSYPGLFYFSAGGYSEYGTPWKKVGDHYFSTK